MNSFIKYFLSVFLLLLVGHKDAFCQKKKKKTVVKGKGKDVRYIKPAKISNTRPNTLQNIPVNPGQDKDVVKEGMLAGRYVDKTPVTSPDQFQTLHRPDNMLEEDSASLFGGEQSIVEVAEEFQIDSTWVKATEYYSIWDAYTLNPYRSDISTFRENLDIVLFDTTKGQYWSDPLEKIYVTSEFGMRGPRWHYGVDLGLDMGDPVLSVWDGIVRLTNWDGGGYGNYVLVRHFNGLETLYGHLSDIQCSIGQIVQAGDLLGKGGSTGRSTGPHLHFEVRYRGVPINPLSIFDFRNRKIRSSVFRLSSDAFSYLGKRPVTPPAPVQGTAEPVARPKQENQQPSYPTRKVYYHQIRKGDNLGAISRKYGITVSTLKKLNGMGNSSVLMPGKRLRIR